MIKEILTLSKLQLKNLFGINEFMHTKDNKKKKRMIGMMIAWAFIILVLGGYIAGLSYGLIWLGAGQIIPMYLYTLISIFMVIITFAKAGNVIFSMKSYDIIISMPVSKLSIVVSRFITMYITNLVASVGCMLIGVITYSIFIGFDLYFCVICLLGAVFLPVLPLTVASVVGAVIIGISSRMRRKSMAQSILMIAFAVTVVVIGFVLPNVLPKGSINITANEMKNIVSMLENVIGEIYPLAMWFNKAVGGQFVYMIGVIGLPSIVFIVFVGILQKYFVAICTMLKGVAAKNNYKLQSLKSNSLIKALWKKEIKRYFASSAYVTNTIIGYLLATIGATVICFVDVDEIEKMIGITGVMPILKMVIPFVISTFMCITSMTACSISLEGKSLWLIKSLPVRSKDVYLGKILANLSVALPFYVVSAIASSIAIRANIMEVVWVFVIPLCYIVFMAVVGITVNLAFPVFNWENEVQVVKQSMATLITMVVGILSCIIPIILTIILGESMASIIKVFVVVILLGGTFVLHNKNGKKDLRQIN